MIDTMLDRCIKCGENCARRGGQWTACAELADDEWLALFDVGALVLLGVEAIETF